MPELETLLTDIKSKQAEQTKAWEESKKVNEQIEADIKAGKTGVAELKEK